MSSKPPKSNVPDIKARLNRAGIRTIDDLARSIDKHAGGKALPMDCIIHSGYFVCP